MRRPRTFADFNFPRLINRYVVALDHPPLRDASRTERPRRSSAFLGSIRPLRGRHELLGVASGLLLTTRLFRGQRPPPPVIAASHPLNPVCAHPRPLDLSTPFCFARARAGALGLGVATHAVAGQNACAEKEGCHAGRLNASRFPPAPRSQWHAHARINSPRFSSRSVRR